MKLFIFLLITIISCAFVASEDPEDLRVSNRFIIDDIRSKLAAVGGCNVNVCFAIDGSGSVTRHQFRRQLDFVIDVISTLSGNPVECAATQYGLINYPISFLSPFKEQFIYNLDAAQLRYSPRTNVGGGIVWCHNQLRKKPREANKIVVLGDGRNNLGGSPAARARRFRRKVGGKVCAVGIGFNRDYRALLRIAGGNPKLVLRVKDVFKLTDILSALVENICGVHFH